jgi:radical SAM superfamily enzyme YgiQ (UPF0313 family)
MPVQYSRGCPFRCEFCGIWKTYGNRPRLKPAQSIVAELEALYALAWRGSVFIVDDNFIGNRTRLKDDLLPEMTKWQKERGFPYRFYTEASINLANDEELLMAMGDAGFNEVFIGIETPSMEALKETGKMHNLRCDMSQAVKKIQKAGISVMAGFILGFDSDTEDVVDRQIHFIQQAGIPQAMVGLLTAMPGTELYDRLEKEGRITAAFDGNNTHSLTANFKTKMSKLELKEGYKKILSTIYDKNLKNYFERCSRLLDNVGKPRLFPRKIQFHELGIALHSLLRQPFTPYGFQYVKFITRNLVKNWSNFPEAVRYAIMGHHFHAITQEVLLQS